MTHDWLRWVFVRPHRRGRAQSLEEMKARRLADDAVGTGKAPRKPGPLRGPDIKLQILDEIADFNHPSLEDIISAAPAPWASPDSSPLEDILKMKAYLESDEYAERIQRENDRIDELNQRFLAEARAKEDAAIEKCLQASLDYGLPGVLVCIEGFNGGFDSISPMTWTVMVGNVPGVPVGEVHRFNGTLKQWEERR